jgi:hypothetical protein
MKHLLRSRRLVHSLVRDQDYDRSDKSGSEIDDLLTWKRHFLAQSRKGRKEIQILIETYTQTNWVKD